MSLRASTFVLPILLCIAAIQMMAAALWTPTSVAPDEDYHHKLVLQVAKQRNPPLWAPRDTAETASLGPVSRYPHLYHQIFGALAALRPEGIWTYAWLRAWNIPLALATLLLVWRVGLGASRGDRRGAAAVLILLSSTPMWLFLGGMAHYDNLTNLLAVTGLGLLFAHVRSPSVVRAAALAAVCATGMLVKIVFLPLAFFLLAIAFVASVAALRDRRHKGNAWATALGWPSGRRSRMGAIALMIAALTLGAAAANQYSTNVLRYGAITPRCDSVLDPAVCEKRYTQFRVAKTRIRENAGNPRMPLPVFVTRYVGEMDRQWDDIHGYVFLRVRTPAWRTIAFWLAVFAGAGSAYRVGWRPWRDAVWGSAALVSLLYFLVLVSENWLGYRVQGAFGVAIHARYLYPVYLALAVVALLPVYRAPTSSRARWAVLALVAGSQFLRGPVDAGGAMREKILTGSPRKWLPSSP